MPRDNEAPGGVRSVHRIELTAKLATRDATLGKGGLLTNCYEEKTPRTTRIVKRPGVEEEGFVGSGCGGQGLVELDGVTYAIGCDTLYRQHYMGMHAVVTTRKYPATESDGSGTSRTRNKKTRYKIKWSVDHCSSHVWSDPCDEDNESGIIDYEHVLGYTLLGVDQNTGNPFTFNTNSHAITLIPGLSLDIAVASGTMSYAGLDLATGNIEFYTKAWSLIASAIVGGGSSDLIFVEPYYYLLTGIADIQVYSELGVLVNTVTLASFRESLGTDSLVVFTGASSAPYPTWCKLAANLSVASSGTFTSGNAGASAGVTISANATHYYAYTQVEIGVTNHPYLVKFDTSWTAVTSYDFGALIVGWSQFSSVIVTPQSVWVIGRKSGPARIVFIEFSFDLAVLGTYVFDETTVVSPVNTIHRDFYA